MATRYPWLAEQSRAYMEEARRQTWLKTRSKMADYLASPEWKAKRHRAFLIWRVLGWLTTLGLVAVRLFAAPYLYGNARILLAWPIQDVAVLGALYAAAIRLSSASRGRPLYRVGHHLGYDHVDTSEAANGVDNVTWPGCTERWFEIVPVTERVNRMESRLRHDRPSPGFGRYLRRTLIALALVRFWWVWIGLVVAVWADGALATHAWMGTALWLRGGSTVLGWLEAVGRRV